MADTCEIYCMPWRGTLDRETCEVVWHTFDPDYGDPHHVLSEEIRNRPPLEVRAVIHHG
jgi:hypothetical protein